MKKVKALNWPDFEDYFKFNIKQIIIDIFLMLILSFKYLPNSKSRLF